MEGWLNSTDILETLGISSITTAQLYDSLKALGLINVGLGSHHEANKS